MRLPPMKHGVCRFPRPPVCQCGKMGWPDRQALVILTAAVGRITLKNEPALSHPPPDRTRRVSSSLVRTSPSGCSREDSRPCGSPPDGEVAGSFGDFYDGTATDVETEASLRVAPHIVSSLEYEHQAVRRPGGSFTARTVRLRLDYATSPRFNTTIFTQWENESERFTVNARLHWIPRAGSDAYLVWNSAWPTGLDGGIPWSRPARGTLIGKLVYYFTL